MTEAHLFSIGLALAALSGVRVYLTVFGVGLAGLMGWVDLPPALQVTSSNWVLGTSGTLALVEFFADKIPGVDSGWDLLHTFLRIPVGAFLAAATLSPDGHLGAAALATGASAAVLGGLTLVFAHPWLALALILGLALSLFGAVLWLAKKLFRKPVVTMQTTTLHFHYAAKKRQMITATLPIRTLHLFILPMNI